MKVIYQNIYIIKFSINKETQPAKSQPRDSVCATLLITRSHIQPSLSNVLAHPPVYFKRRKPLMRSNHKLCSTTA
jgi:hypothetical protein